MMALHDWQTRCLDGRKPPLPCVKRVGLLLHRCVKPSLPPRLHGWIFAEASYEQLSAISRAAAVTAPKKIWTHEMEQAESAAEAAHEAHTLPHPETAYFEPNVPEKRRNEIKPYAVASLCFWKPARKDVEPHPARGGDIFTAWRRRTLILWNRLCSALNLAAYAPCLGSRQICLSVILCGFTCRTALYCCCCLLHSFGSWWLGNGSAFPAV
ncbi:hypothetical protein TcCL_Unassigned00231 [Trypanosoma cruzi]|nr:hypothetical protein TcCL_Unassigned00231 [Trypanosoma cruzi]